MREQVACQDCEKPFIRKISEPWRVLCVPCWKAENGHTAGCRRCAELEKDLMQARQNAPQVPADAPPKAVLRFLLKQAHPDRHGGKPEAAEAVRWLLELRQKEGAGHDF